MIEFNKVSKVYPNGHEALYEIEFQLAKGEMAFLTGHSGAGKSTLLKLIMLIERWDRGEIIIGGRDLGSLSNRLIPRLRRSIGMVFQNPMLLEDRTIYENVALPLDIAGWRPHNIARRVRAALDKIGLLHKEKCYPAALSGGEQQRVGIARAVVNKPPVLLADEPTGNLDPALSTEIMRLFEEFNRVGVTVLIASHDVSLITSLGYRKLTLEKGALVGEHLYA